MLKVRDLVVAYGGIEALKGISIDVPEGQIVTLIGANGAGKSTLLRTIMGLEKPRSGSVEYNEENLKGLNSQHIVTRGITLVPEGRRVFPNLTVLENLRIGAYLRKDEDGILKDIQRIYELFPRLEERNWQMAGTLSGGEQQMLALGRALMCRPKLIMMDEPSLGLAPLVIKEIFNIIRRINESGTTVLLVEQNANMALKVAHHAYVLETGRIKMEGSGRELLENEEIGNCWKTKRLKRRIWGKRKSKRKIFAMKHKTVQGFHKTVCVFVIPWTYAPVASKLGASHLKQSRHRGAFHLME